MKYRMHTLLLMLLMCWASQSPAQPTRAKAEQMARLKEFHLDKIQLAAENFITLENNQHKTNLQIDEINLKTLVPDCTVPLKASWAPKDRVYRKSVAVICSKSVSKDIFKTWVVYIPVTIQKN